MKILVNMIWMVFFLSILIWGKNYYEDEQLNKGRAISRYLEENHKKTVPPAEARFLILEVTEYDIDLGDITIFTK